jgi:predicted nucleotide-binding protein (sugar kinase/HSP70/actin superfamily)
VCREARLPALFLVLDEHVEEAGLVTRLEAFVDLLSAQVSRGCGAR